MDIALLFSTAIDFAKLLALATVISFILYKIFSPVREWLAEKYSLSWFKSALALNFSAIFVFILVIYLYFMLIGVLSAPPVDSALDNNLMDYAMLIISAIPRILISSVTLALFLLFFEFVASFFMSPKENQKSQKGRGKSSFSWFDQVIGIAIACAVFIFLILFVFNWVPLGLFIYIFYGSLEPLPVLIVLAGI